MKRFGAVFIILLVVIGPGCMNDKDSSKKSDQVNSQVSVKVSEKSPAALSKTMPFQILAQEIETWSGHLDLINDQGPATTEIKVTTPRLKLMGWFGDTARGVTPVKAAFYFKNGEVFYYAEMPLNLVRPDVAEAFKKKNLANSGFDFIVDISELPSGKYEIGFLGQTKTAAGKCASEFSIVK